MKQRQAERMKRCKERNLQTVNIGVLTSRPSFFFFRYSHIRLLPASTLSLPVLSWLHVSLSLSLSFPRVSAKELKSAPFFHLLLSAICSIRTACFNILTLLPLRGSSSMYMRSGYEWGTCCDQRNSFFTRVEAQDEGALKLLKQLRIRRG